MTIIVLILATLATIIFVCFLWWLGNSIESYYKKIGYEDPVSIAHHRLLIAKMYNRNSW